MGQKAIGHFHGMQTIPGLEKVPVWCNIGNIQFPDEFSQLKLKDWIVDMYNTYEKDNQDIISFKKMKGV